MLLRRGERMLSGRELDAIRGPADELAASDEEKKEELDGGDAGRDVGRGAPGANEGRNCRRYEGCDMGMWERV